MARGGVEETGRGGGGEGGLWAGTGRGATAQEQQVGRSRGRPVDYCIDPLTSRPVQAAA